MDTVDIERTIHYELRQSLKFQRLGDRDSFIHAVCGLSEEAGEVVGLLNREVFKQKEVTDTQWIDELGDVLWYLAAIVVLKGYSFEDLFNHNIGKLASRYGVAFNEKEQR